MKLALVGDVMLGRGVRDALTSRPPEMLWGDLLGELAWADARIANLECAITSHRVRWTRTFKVFHFRADPGSGIRALQAAGFDVVALANNHSLDFEEEGLFETLERLDEAGIAHAGAGRDLAEARRPALVETPGGTLGVLSATDNEPAFAASPTRPGTWYLDVESPESIAELGRGIATARALGAEVVVVSMHWGPNMVERPPRHFRAFARAVLELGADVFHGHSAHLTQGIELWRGRPILYDTGDFLDDYAVDPVLRNDWSFLFQLEISPAGLERISLVPVKLSFARVQQATGGERVAMLARMRALCAERGTTLVQTDGRLEWQVEAGISTAP